MEMSKLIPLLSVSPEVEALRQDCDPHRLAVGHVLELACRPARKAWDSGNINLHLGSAKDFPLDSAATALAEQFTKQLAGQGWEQKYRVALLSFDDQQNLSVTLVPTTYEVGTGFHRALQIKDPNENQVQLHKAQWLKRLSRLGQYALPGISVVHAIVLTADQKILLAKRSPNTNYAPSHWSVSFEEQITTKDVDKGNAVFGSAAARGFAEEFFADSQLPFTQLPVLSVFLDTTILNIGFCVEVQVPWTSDEVAASWKKRPRDYWEAVDLFFTPVSLESIAHLLRGRVSYAGLDPGAMLHETSQYRLLVLALRYFAYDELVQALR